MCITKCYSWRFGVGISIPIEPLSVRFWYAANGLECMKYVSVGRNLCALRYFVFSEQPKSRITLFDRLSGTEFDLISFDLDVENVLQSKRKTQKCTKYYL